LGLTVAVSFFVQFFARFAHGLRMELSSNFVVWYLEVSVPHVGKIEWLEVANSV